MPTRNRKLRMFLDYMNPQYTDEELKGNTRSNHEIRYQANEEFGSITRGQLQREFIVHYNVYGDVITDVEFDSHGNVLKKDLAEYNDKKVIKILSENNGGIDHKTFTYGYDDNEELKEIKEEYIEPIINAPLIDLHLITWKDGCKTTTTTETIYGENEEPYLRGKIISIWDKNNILRELHDYDHVFNHGEAKPDVKKYDEFGNIISSYSQGATDTYTYNKDGMLLQKISKRSDGNEFIATFKYDDQNRLLVKKSEDENIENVYDDHGQLISKWVSGYQRSSFIEYEYDDNGNVAREQFYKFIDLEGFEQNGHAVFEYDIKNNLVKRDFYSEYKQLGGRIILKYDEKDRITSKVTYGEGGAKKEEEIFVYDEFNWIKRTFLNRLDPNMSFEIVRNITYY